ncbi:uncharacterized protein [Panulirus ornatus]|uniref:uncharacterized protein n=1 Tax=Panulirus ornatus TaxID=150431 RepID=UPI003A877ED4
MANSNFVLNNCCFCASLRTGSLIIAIFTLVISLFGAAYSIFLGVTGSNEGWVDLAIDIIHIVLASILINGICTERRSLVNLWVWGTAFLVAVAIVLGIVFILLTDSLYVAIVLFIVSVIQIYFVLVVRSYALTLSDGLPVVAGRSQTHARLETVA